MTFIWTIVGLAVVLLFQELTARLAYRHGLINGQQKAAIALLMSDLPPDVKLRASRIAYPEGVRRQAGAPPSAAPAAEGRAAS